MLLGLVYYDNKQNLVFLEYARSPQGFVYIINHYPHGVEKLDFLLISNATGTLYLPGRRLLSCPLDYVPFLHLRF